MILDILMTIVGAALVLVGADKLTDGSVALARRFSIPEMVIGLTIVAFGTSLPEFIVSLFASIQGAPAMSIGNIVGSNLFNTLMIVGLSAVVCPIVISRATVAKDIPLSLLASIALPALALDTVFSGSADGDILSHGDGIVLLCFFAIFMAYTFSMAKSGRIDGVGETSEGATSQLSGWRTTLYIVLGIAGLIGGGELFVDGACGIARSLGVSEAVIGLTLVAGGTSLPELATSVVAARKGKSDIAIGNVVGSNLFNIFWILGMCAMVSPLAVQGIRPADFAVLVGSMVLFWLFARTKHRVARWEGAVLVACYAAYLTTLILA